MRKLILINGAPASGKSTIARLLVQENPDLVLIEIDSLRREQAEWPADPLDAGLAARRVALHLAEESLTSNRDVVIPQFLARDDFILQLETLADRTGTRFIEIALVSSPAEAEERFQERSASVDPNHQDAVLLQERADARPVGELYQSMMAMLQCRPETHFVRTDPGDIEGTLSKVRSIVTGY